jgi:predicted secreted protein
MSGSGFAKAQIVKLDKQGKACDHIDVKFNPKELTFSKQNNWKQANNPKTNIPDCEFSGGGAATLKVQLFFDTYAEREDVRKKYTDKIYQLTQVDPTLTDKKNKKGRPPTVRFQWGSTIGFDGVITTVGQRFTLFLPDDGTPVRAVMDITFSQVKDELFYPPQNPTSGGVGGERVWTVKAGDTLAWIAFSEYNNPTEWRRIADANRLYHVRRLTPGMMLLIPNA